MSLLELQRDPKGFRAALMIDTDAGPRPFAEVIEPWQTKDFEALDDGWKRAVVGTKHKATYSRGWLERSRGHSKSQDIAIQATWALFASRRRLSCVAAAGDQDQARLIRNAISRLIYINPFLANLLEVQVNRVVNKRTRSELEIISSDAPTSWGLTPDAVICDEVHAWAKRDLFDSLLSSAAKRSTCMFVCITNAGLQDDWVWEQREKIRVDPLWYFSRLDGPQASWISAATLAEQERLLPAIAFRRLWLNEWTTGGSDCFAEGLISAAFVSGLQPLSGATPDYEFVGGLDLSVSRHASALCVLGVKCKVAGFGKIRLAYTKMWKPSKAKHVDYIDVENTIVDVNERFKLKALNYDPYESRYMSQRLQSIGLGVESRQVGRHHMTTKVPMNEITQTGANLQKIATVMIEAFNDKRVELFENADLYHDLTRMRVEERSYGFRLVSPVDQQGHHGDLGTAFSLAMLAASELIGKRKVTAGVFGDSAEYGTQMTPLQRALNERDEYRAFEAALERELMDNGDRYGRCSDIEIHRLT